MQKRYRSVNLLMGSTVGPFDNDYSLRTLPFTFAVHVVFRVPCGAIWGVLCFWIQTRVQHQGFRGQYSGAWRDDRSHGLPVRYSNTAF